MITPGTVKLIAGGVGTAILAGSFYYQSLQIHHYHTLYDDAIQTIALRDQKIKDMTDAQNTQTAKSEGNVIKVIQIPEKVQPIINQIKTAPVDKPCAPPNYSDEVKNAF